MTDNRFTSPDALARQLADDLAGKMRESIAARGRVCIAVSGGSTPVRFLEELSKRKLDWSKVRVTLVDERWVPINSSRSNQRLVTLELLQQNAAKAHLLGLYREDIEAEEINHIDDELKDLMPFDVVVLGMGTDGHTASLFPGGDKLLDATRKDSKQNLTYMNAPDAGETRVTLTLPAIASAKNLLLHIEGQTKRDVLEEAIESGEPAQLPIRYVLDACPDLRVVWAP